MWSPVGRAKACLRHHLLFEEFKSKFKVDDEVMKGFFKLADKKGLKKDETGYKTSEKYILKKYSTIEKLDKKAPFVVSSEITKLKTKQMQR